MRTGPWASFYVWGHKPRSFGYRLRKAQQSSNSWNGTIIHSVSQQTSISMTSVMCWELWFLWQLLNTKDGNSDPHGLALWGRGKRISKTNAGKRWKECLGKEMHFKWVGQCLPPSRDTTLPYKPLLWVPSSSGWSLLISVSLPPHLNPLETWHPQSLAQIFVLQDPVTAPTEIRSFQMEKQSGIRTFAEVQTKSLNIV